MDKLTERGSTHIDGEGEGEGEGFENMSEKSREDILGPEELYDDFYAKAYNKIFQHDKLVQAEAAIVLQDWEKGMSHADMRILDLCCGTGVASCFFAKQGAGKVFALDRSKPMLRYAEHNVLPKTTLTPQQTQSIEWIQADAYGPGALEPSSVTHAALLYFSVYYFRDLDTLFRNLAHWVKPGGQLIIEAVNKYKFEPVPDVANPWIAISPQKYSKNRITTSKAAFDTFDYETEFDLEDPRAEFKETFRFKDGTVRRQKHILWMPTIEQIVEKAKRVGWTYQKYTNLDMIGFNYGYLLYFTRGEL